MNEESFISRIMSMIGLKESNKPKYKMVLFFLLIILIILMSIITMKSKNMSEESFFLRILSAIGLKESNKPKYKTVLNPSELTVLIPACYKGKAGFINELGEWVIEPKFEDCDEFTDNGLAPASKNGKYGFIDKGGKFVIEPEYE